MPGASSSDAVGPRVAYDLTPALIGSTGVARYVRELHRTLHAAGVDLQPFALGRLAQRPNGVRHVRVPLRALHAAWRLRLPPAWALVGRFDVLHATALPPPPTRQPVVVTVHDLEAVERPDLHGRRRAAVQRRVVDAAARSAHAIAVSRTTADALVRHGVPAERVTVVHSGIRRLAPAEPVPTGSRFLLAVGTLEARKGLDTLIRAFATAPLDGVELVIAGPDGNATAALARLQSELGVESRVHRVGPVSDGQLAHLYRSCIGLCAPTRGEGFGFTFLEAAAAGAPVIASDLPVLREIMGDAFLPVAVDDVAGWTDALRQLVSDEQLRASLIERGGARAARFSWESAATETAAIYEAAASSRSR